MKLIVKWLVITLSFMAFGDQILVSGGRHQKGTTTPEPVTFPYGIVCTKNIGLRPRDEKQTKKCCKEGNAPCKTVVLRGDKVKYACIAQDHEARNKTIECCKNGGCDWERTGQKKGDDC